MNLGLDFSFSNLAAGFVFGVFGMALIKRAKAEGNLVRAAAGFVLIIFPYFVKHDVLVWIVGTAVLLFGYKTQ